MPGRIRSIKPEILEDERTARLSDTAWRMFVSLWLLADDHGALRAEPDYLAGQVLWGTGAGAPAVLSALAELGAAGLVLRYQVRAQNYVQIKNWLKHQRVDHPSKPRVPRHDDPTAIPVLGDPREASRDSLSTLATDLRSPTTDQGSPITDPEWEITRAIAPPGTRDHVRDHATHEPCHTYPQAYPQSDWHRRKVIWDALLNADARVRRSGVEPNGLPLPKSCAGQNERDLADCMRQLAESFGADQVDAKLLHVIAVAEDEAIGKRTRKWFRAAVVFSPKKILDSATKPIGYWRTNGAKPSSGRAASAIEAQLERVAMLEAKEAS